MAPDRPIVAGLSEVDAAQPWPMARGLGARALIAIFLVGACSGPAAAPQTVPTATTSVTPTATTVPSLIPTEAPPTPSPTSAAQGLLTRAYALGTQSVHVKTRERLQYIVTSGGEAPYDITTTNEYRLPDRVRSIGWCTTSYEGGQRGARVLTTALSTPVIVIGTQPRGESWYLGKDGRWGRFESRGLPPNASVETLVGSTGLPSGQCGVNYQWILEAGAQVDGSEKCGGDECQRITARSQSAILTILISTRTGLVTRRTITNTSSTAKFIAVADFYDYGVPNVIAPPG